MRRCPDVHPKTNTWNQSKVHKTHTHTPIGLEVTHNTYLHRHPNILSEELLWHPVHMCDVAAVSLKIKLGYSDLTVCSAKRRINAGLLMISAVSKIMPCYWNTLAGTRKNLQNCSHENERICMISMDRFNDLLIKNAFHCKSVSLGLTHTTSNVIGSRVS